MELYQENPQFRFAEKICQDLARNGYKAYLAGGCVRDMILRVQPRDFDVATNALPEQVEKLFPKTVAVGKSFGVINVIGNNGEEVEVATFRTDGGYQDGRRPESVTFSSEREDAQRRDLTINALFYDLQTKQILDFVGGEADIQNQLIRTVGDASKRFEEDHLRILRAVRFVSQTGFQIEDKTLQAIKDQRTSVLKISGERIQDEITKLLQGKQVNQSLKLLWITGVLEELLNFETAWLDATGIFSRKTNVAAEQLEDLWFRFFLWIYRGAELAGKKNLNIKDFEDLCEQWKFSRKLKQKTLTSFYWLLHNSFLKKTSVGELLELSFESENLRAWNEYEVFYANDVEKEILAHIKEKKQILGLKKPEPFVKANDLISMVSGPELGKALSWCYWRQLEGLGKSREELLNLWKVQYGKK